MYKLLLGFFLPALAFADPSDLGGIRVWLDDSIENGRLVIVPYVQAERELLLEYELTGRKTGKSGRSNTRQSGSVRIPKNQAQSLARLVFNFDRDDKIEINIQLKQNGKIIHDQSLSYP